MSRLPLGVVRGVALVSLVAIVATRISAQELRPPLKASLVLGEIAGGAYAGIGGFVIGRYAGERLGDAFDVASDDSRDRLGFATGIFIAGLATAGTVYGIGNIGSETGDFDATYLGTGIGFIAAAGVARLVMGPGERPREGSSTAARWALANVIALLPAVGATIAFNSTRRAQ